MVFFLQYPSEEHATDGGVEEINATVPEVDASIARTIVGDEVAGAIPDQSWDRNQSANDSSKQAEEATHVVVVVGRGERRGGGSAEPCSWLKQQNCGKICCRICREVGAFARSIRFRLTPMLTLPLNDLARSAGQRSVSISIADSPLFTPPWCKPTHLSSQMIISAFCSFRS